MMEAIEQAEAQIKQAEQEIYESLQESDARIALHDDSSLQGLLSLNSDDVSLGNLQIADSMAETSGDHAIQAKQLRNLLGVRVVVLQAKADLLQHGVGFAEPDDEVGDLENRVMSNSRQANYYLNQFGADVESISGDAKIIKEQIDQLRANDMNSHS